MNPTIPFHAAGVLIDPPEHRQPVNIKRYEYTHARNKKLPISLPSPITLQPEATKAASPPLVHNTITIKYNTMPDITYITTVTDNKMPQLRCTTQLHVQRIKAVVCLPHLLPPQVLEGSQAFCVTPKMSLQDSDIISSCGTFERTKGIAPIGSRQLSQPQITSA